MRTNEIGRTGWRGLLATLCVLASAWTMPAQAALPAHITIQGERIFPESLTSSPNGTVIIGSILQHEIYRAPPSSALATPWITARKTGIRSIFGVLADSRSNTLWACSDTLGPPHGSPPPRAVLYAFNLQNGDVKARYPFPAAGSLCNDISIGPDGTTYATDSNNMEVVRLGRGGKRLHVWAGNGAFGPRGGVVDGIVVLGGRVIVGTLVTSKLFSVPILADGKAGKVTQMKLSHPLAGPDGIRRFGVSGVLIAEHGDGGRLSKAALRGDTATVTTVQRGFADGPVAVTVVGTTAYVLGGQLNLLLQHSRVQPKPFRATAVQVGVP
jgi:hypothetical protein